MSTSIPQSSPTSLNNHCTSQRPKTAHRRSTSPAVNESLVVNNHHGTNDVATPRNDDDAALRTCCVHTTTFSTRRTTTHVIVRRRILPASPTAPATHNRHPAPHNERRGLASGENDERRLVRRFFHDIMARAVRAMLQTVANDERRTDFTASFRPLNLVATSLTAAWQPNDERRLVVCHLSADHLQEHGVEHWIPVFVDLVNVFIAKSQFYSSWKGSFSRAQKYPQMKSWLDADSDAESDSEVWAETKDPDYYTLADLAEWLKRKDVVKGKKPAVASSSAGKKSVGKQEKRKKERRTLPSATDSIWTPGGLQVDFWSPCGV
ncbi:hypothetical protein K443DRAFT_15955 [Laccaria amethystina LaAM-08-1]|uniref:Uncharacterized protein n=1 Tax=Laccaria amethystina LaAM-08-1 TaxID=1095629 RepID=A0A0C9WGK4_9AGAR|nr:hypothetical protein K443DRAFT_15955 [Laccaria amethystina LaAM-08-1]